MLFGEIDLSLSIPRPYRSRIDFAASKTRSQYSSLMRATLIILVIFSRMAFNVATYIGKIVAVDRNLLRRS